MTILGNTKYINETVKSVIILTKVQIAKKYENIVGMYGKSSGALLT